MNESSNANDQGAQQSPPPEPAEQPEKQLEPAEQTPSAEDAATAAETPEQTEINPEPVLSGSNYEFAEPQLGAAEISEEVAESVDLQAAADEAARVEHEAELVAQKVSSPLGNDLPAPTFDTPEEPIDWDTSTTVLRTDFSKPPVANNPWTQQEPAASAESAAPAAPDADPAPAEPVAPQPQIPAMPPAPPAPTFEAPEQGQQPTQEISHQPEVPAQNPDDGEAAAATPVAAAATDAAAEAAPDEAAPHFGPGIADDHGWRRPETQWTQSATPWKPKAGAWQSPAQMARGEADAAAAAALAGTQGAGNSGLPQPVPTDGTPGRDLPVPNGTPNAAADPSGATLPYGQQLNQPPYGAPTPFGQPGGQVPYGAPTPFGQQNASGAQPPYGAAAPQQGTPSHGGTQFSGTAGVPPTPGTPGGSQNPGYPGGPQGPGGFQGGPQGPGGFQGGPQGPGFPGGPQGPGGNGGPSGNGKKKLFIILGIAVLGVALIGFFVWLLVGFIAGNINSASPSPVPASQSQSQQSPNAEPSSDATATATKGATPTGEATPTEEPVDPDAGIIVPMAAPLDWLEGDCFRNFTSISWSADVVLCNSPHSAQLVGTFYYGQEEDFPGVDALKAKAAEVCADVQMTTEAAKIKTLKPMSAYPTETTWNESDDRRVDCLVHDTRDGNNLKVSLTK